MITCLNCLKERKRGKEPCIHCGYVFPDGMTARAYFHALEEMRHIRAEEEMERKERNTKIGVAFLIIVWILVIIYASSYLIWK